MAQNLCLPGIISQEFTEVFGKRRNVRATSRAIFHEMQPQLQGRKAAVLSYLEEYANCHASPPTSGELWEWKQGVLHHPDRTSALLYIRRGLSDLCKIGLIESVPLGDRKCRSLGKKCVTWRIVSR